MGANPSSHKISGEGGSLAFFSGASPAPDNGPVLSSEEPLEVSDNSKVPRNDGRRDRVLNKIQLWSEAHRTKVFADATPEAIADVLSNANKINEMLQSVLRGRQTLQVKIVLIGSPKLFQKFVAYVGGFEYNALHVGLQVDEILVDWCDSSLVYARTVESPIAFAAIDVGELDRNEYTEDPIITLSKLMEKWNVNNTYSMRACNCQHFIDEALESLKLYLPSTGAIANFLSAVRKGKLSKTIPPLKDIDPDAPEVFKDHASLDEYVRKLFLKYSPKNNLTEGRAEFKAKHPDIFHLLKDFDRAFWITHLKNQNNPPAAGGCPIPPTEKTSPSAARVNRQAHK